MNELLLVVIGIFAVCILIGINKGLIRIAASLLATLLVLVLVSVATPYVSDILAEKTPLAETVKEKCVEKLNLEAVDTSVREGQIVAIERAELPQIFKDLLLANNNIEVYESLGISEFGEYVGAYLAKLVLNIVSFLITFVLVTLIVRVGLYILGIVGDLPLIGGLNRLAGGAVGIITGLIVVWILFIAITVFYDMSISQLFLKNVRENEFLTFLYDKNILMTYLTKFRG